MVQNIAFEALAISCFKTASKLQRQPVLSRLELPAVRGSTRDVSRSASNLGFTRAASCTVSMCPKPLALIFASGSSSRLWNHQRCLPGLYGTA